VLHQRGRLLGELRGRTDAGRLLAPWDEQLAALGSEIVHRRLETLTRLRDDVREIWRMLAADDTPLELDYAAVVPPAADPAATREGLLAALASSRQRELGRGATLVGPHRDDLVVRLGRVEARTYASRGEQRLIVLTLRLAEAAAVRRRLGSAPVLLLDDLLSELDGAARERVLGWLLGQGQVVFSAPDAAAGLAGAVWDVHEGEVDALDAIVAGGAA
jgi:DNA replication and repair protein RecF